MIVALWLISHFVENKSPTEDDIDSFVKKIIDMEMINGVYLEVAD
jgi:hypothetical protein